MPSITILFLKYYLSTFTSVFHPICYVPWTTGSFLTLTFARFPLVSGSIQTIAAKVVLLTCHTRHSCPNPLHLSTTSPNEGEFLVNSLFQPLGSDRYLPFTSAPVFTLNSYVSGKQAERTTPVISFRLEGLGALFHDAHLQNK